MHGMNAEVIRSMCDWLERGDKVWLATIVDTWGASPRPIGSLFAYNPELNLVSGSLSGGCIEDALLDQLKDNPAQNIFKHRYGDSPEEQERFQLPCGGVIELVIEHRSPEDLPLFKQIEQSLTERKQVIRCVDLKSGELTLKPVSSIVASSVCCSACNLEQVLGPQYQLLIVGAGEVCNYLVPIAKSLDFAVTVCDPRVEVIERTPLHEKNVELVIGLPDDLVMDRFSDAHCAVVALAHDPRVDDLALIAALNSKAFFVGAMGSERTSQTRIQRLKHLGINQAQLSRLEAPVGLDIHSKTPPEIAISVAAQLIKHRHRNAS